MKTEMKEVNTELVVLVKGEVSKSNLKEYVSEVKTFVSSLPTDLVTEEDFDGAKKNVTGLKFIEEKSKEAQGMVLEQAADINEVINELKGLTEYASDVRKGLTRKIKESDELRRAEILADVMEGLDEYYSPVVQQAGKGKQLKGYEKALIEKSQELKQVQAEKLEEIDDYANEYGEDLIHGKQALLRMDMDLLKLELESRRERRRAALEKAMLEEEKRQLEEAARKQKEEETKAVPVPEPETGKSLPKEERVETPTPPALGVSPEEHEWQTYKSNVISSLAKLKQVRTTLVHERNQKRAYEFAIKINEAWEDMNGDEV